MCQFFSALVLKNGDVLSHPMLDSHADLVRYFKLPDTVAHHQHFAKIELTPVDWMDVATWQFRLDEASAPGWWPDVADRAERQIRDRATRMILSGGEHALIVDGCWIVGGTAKIRDIRGGRIVRVQDTAILSGVWNSAQVSGVRDSAQVSDVGGSAQVSDVGGSARVSGVRGSAQVSGVRGSAQVSDVWGSARVSDVRDSAQVSNVAPSVTLDDSAKAHLLQRPERS
jgi:hypothetical protein